MKSKFLLLILIVSAVLLQTGKTPGHPRFAAMLGNSCSRCHTNGNGGGMRNQFGAVYFSGEDLPLVTREEMGSGNFDTGLNEHIRIGSDVRVQFFHYRHNGRSDDALFPMQGDLYLSARPSSSTLLYLEQSLFRTVASTGVWGQISDGDGGSHVRMGRFRQTFGLRVDDHTSFVRGGNDGDLIIDPAFSGIEPQFQGLHWKPENYTTGVELRYLLNDLAVTGSFGMHIQQDDYSVALDASMPFRMGPVAGHGGASFFHGSYYSGLKPYSYYAVYAGTGLGPLIFLGELDLSVDYPRLGSEALAGYVELSYRAAQGIFLRMEYHHFDANMGTGNNELNRYGIGAEIFPVPYIEIEPFYRLVQATYNPGYSRQEFLLQVHFWL